MGEKVLVEVVCGSFVAVTTVALMLSVVGVVARWKERHLRSVFSWMIVSVVPAVGIVLEGVTSSRYRAPSALWVFAAPLVVVGQWKALTAVPLRGAPPLLNAARLAQVLSVAAYFVVLAAHVLAM